MILPQLLLLAVCLSVVGNFISILQRGKRGMWKLGVKESINSLVPLFTLIWIMLLIILLVVSIPTVTDWAASQKLNLENPNPSTLWAYGALPSVYSFTGLAVIIVLLAKLLKYRPFKYNETEQAILKQDSDRRKEKLKRFVPAKVLNWVFRKQA